MTEPRLFDGLTVPMIGSTFGDDTARARRSDHTTSHEAADTNNVRASLGLVLALLREHGPMADHELVARIHTFTGQRVRTARAALVGRGLVEATGFYRLTPTGRRAQVWALVDEGLAS